MAFFDFLTKPFRNIDKEEPKEKEINTIIIQDSARGTSGTEVYAGYFDEEYLDTLKNSDAACVYDKIARSDTQAKMLLSAIQNPIRTAPYEITSQRDEDIFNDHAEVCKRVLLEDIDMDRFVDEALKAPKYGNAVFEKVHQVNINKPILDEDGRVILDSYVGLNKLGWRSPKTIETWNFDQDTKELVSIRQCVDGDLSVDVDIPVRHLIIITMDKEGDNYEGVSMLRAIYGNWYRKNTYLKLNAIGIEKSMPIPTAEVPQGQENSEQFRNLVTALERFTTHQKNYLTYPAGWNIQLSNGTAYDPSKVEQSIDNEDKRMAKAFLANFLELGLSGTGAFALSNDLSDFFLSSLVYIARLIEKPLNDLCKEITILNFGEQEVYPKFKFTGIKDKAGKEFADILKLMVDSKVIIPDDKLEDHVRNKLNITKRSEDGQREQQAPLKFSEIDIEKLSLSEKIQRAINNNIKMVQ
ncbi:hypothetical protein KAR91_40725 [Candidatus Pacearchaeota archaeon]|nr:hypothetical protein [Candidatus Pacearchaeota archaeon]